MEILPRSEWTDSAPGFPKFPGRKIDPSSVWGLVLHWPGDGGRNYASLTKEQVRAMINRYRTYHVEVREWADIGYPYVIDMAGRIWLAAGTSHAAAHSASDAYPTANSELMAALLLIGEDETPSPEMVESVVWLNAFLRSNQFPNMTQLLGHQQVRGASTQCPGKHVMEYINRGAFSVAFVSPAQGRVTSNWGWRERHPVTGVRGFHRGLDIAPPVPGQRGVPLYACVSGTIRTTVTGRKRGDKRPNPVTGTWNTGNCIILDGDDGNTYYYGHPDTVAVRAGQRVAAGTYLGTMGDSGNVTGVHLHLEVWKGRHQGGGAGPGNTIDPRIVFKKHNVAPGSKPVFVKSPVKPIGEDWLNMDKTEFNQEASRHAENVVKQVTENVRKMIANQNTALHNAMKKETDRAAQDVISRVGQIPGVTDADVEKIAHSILGYKHKAMPGSDMAGLQVSTYQAIRTLTALVESLSGALAAVNAGESFDVDKFLDGVETRVRQVSDEFLGDLSADVNLTIGKKND